MFNQMISQDKLEALCKQHGPVARNPPKRSAAQVVRDLVCHQLSGPGTLAEHAARLGGQTISDPAYSQRRALLPQTLFEQVLESALAPLADEKSHPQSFYKGWRLVGVDGTELSVTNTPGLRALPKAGSRRGKAAFAKIKLVSAVELGVHNPLAASTGTLRDGEVALALKLWPRLPKHSLVIVDRLYGVGAHVGQMLEAGRHADQALLVRARGRVKARVLKNLGDGSTLVEIGKGDKAVRLREIRVTLKVPGVKKPVPVRLWTTLLDPDEHPALELAQLYAWRWEHELANRELKLDMRGSDRLDSHTVLTAHQEIAAVLLALACVARVRVSASEALESPAMRISFGKLLAATQALWEAHALCGASLGAEQKAAMFENYLSRLKREVILPRRRARHCPRAVRKPVSGWPRLRRRTESTGLVITLLAQ